MLIFLFVQALALMPIQYSCFSQISYCSATSAVFGECDKGLSTSKEALDLPPGDLSVCFKMSRRGVKRVPVCAVYSGVSSSVHDVSPQICVSICFRNV